MQVGIDIMGGENSPATLFQAIYQLAKEQKQDFFFQVFATASSIKKIQSIYSISELASLPLTFVSSKDEVLASDLPLHVIRQKKHASMFLGLRALRDKRLDAFVTPGNTGALIVASSIYLDKLPSMTRPALLSLLPSKNGSVAMTDVGGNIIGKVENFIEYVTYASAFQRIEKNITTPTVGLLNIGKEPSKGPAFFKKVYKVLAEFSKSSPFNFFGNIEGSEIFDGHVDVVVTDGFTGNVFLKTAEGIYSFILEHINRSFSKEKQDDRFIELKRLVSCDSYSGALVTAVDKCVIKSHGSVSPELFYKGIKSAIYYVDKGLHQRIREGLV